MKKNIFHIIIASLSLSCLSSSTLNAMQELENPSSFSTTSKRMVDCVAVDDNYALNLKDYPTSTSSLDEALVTAIRLFNSNQHHIVYMDGLLTEVKETSDLSKKSAKYFGYFGRPAVLPGDIIGLNYSTISDLIIQIDGMHQKVKKGLNQYLELLEDRLTKHRTIAPIQELWKKEVDQIIQGLSLWIDNSEFSFKKSIDDCEQQIRNRLRRKNKNPNRRYTNILREDHIIDFLTDQKDVWSIVRDIFRPYSSCPPLPPIEIVLVKEEILDNTLPQKSTKSAEKNKRKRQKRRLRIKEKFQAVSNEDTSVVPLQITNGTTKGSLLSDEVIQPVEDDVLTNEVKKEEFVDQSLNKPQSVNDDKISTMVLSPENNDLSVDISDFEAKSPLKDENNFQKDETFVPTLLKEDFPNKKRTRKKKKLQHTSMQNEGLSIKRNNYEVLESIFQKPISKDIDMESFDNMIRSESGFRGRVYGGKKSTIYEIYVTLDSSNQPQNFVSFFEYNQLKKQEANVRKYSFTLHRPHLRGTNQKGHVNMYPALVERAADRLTGLNLTLNTIASK